MAARLLHALGLAVAPPLPAACPARANPTRLVQRAHFDRAASLARIAPGAARRRPDPKPLVIRLRFSEIVEKAGRHRDPRRRPRRNSLSMRRSPDGRRSKWNLLLFFVGGKPRPQPIRLRWAPGRTEADDDTPALGPSRNPY